MRTTAIVLLLFGLLGWLATVVDMALSLRAAAPNPAALAQEISFSLVYSMAGSVCFCAGIILFVLDFVLRRGAHSEAHSPGS